MKKALAILILLSAQMIAAQAVRWDAPIWTVNTSTPDTGGLYPMLAFPYTPVSICATWNGLGCTSLATTYTDQTEATPCPSNAQLTPANGSGCSADTDIAGGAGAWLASGNYAYFVTSSYSQTGTFGPYIISLPTGCALTGCNLTGPVNAPSVNTIVNACRFTGADLGAQINAAITSLGSTIGIVQINQACNTTLSTAVNLGSNTLQCTQGGTYSIGATITMGQYASITSMLPKGTNGAPCIFQETSAANLPEMIHMTSQGNISNIYLNGNGSTMNATTCAAINGCNVIFVDNANRIVLDSVDVHGAQWDNLHVSGSSSCCGRIVGHSFFINAGHDNVYMGQSAGDWIMSTTEFEQACQWGIEGEDAATARMTTMDIGANGTCIPNTAPTLTASIAGTTLTVTVTSGLITPGLQLTGVGITTPTFIVANAGGNGGTGNYTVNYNYPGGISSESMTTAYMGGGMHVFTSATNGNGSGWEIANSQFGTNWGNDFEADGSNVSGSFAGSHVLSGNLFLGLNPSTVTDTYSSVVINGAGGNTVTGNSMAGGGAAQYKYHFVTTSLSGAQNTGSTFNGNIFDQGGASTDISSALTDGGSNYYAQLVKQDLRNMAVFNNVPLYCGDNINRFWGCIQTTSGALGALQLAGAPNTFSGDNHQIQFYPSAGTQAAMFDQNQLQLGVHLNQTAAHTFAGTCSMSTGTTCTDIIGTGYTSTPVCVATAQGTAASPPAAACGVSGSTVTITASASNSLTWAYVLIGNPN